MKIFAILAMLLLIGCGRAVPDPNENKMPVGNFSQLSTVTYENHKLILAKSTNGIAVMHHPDCPCLHQKGK